MILWWILRRVQIIHTGGGNNLQKRTLYKQKIGFSKDSEVKVALFWLKICVCHEKAVNLHPKIMYYYSYYIH